MWARRSSRSALLVGELALALGGVRILQVLEALGVDLHLPSSRGDAGGARRARRARRAAAPPARPAGAPAGRGRCSRRTRRRRTGSRRARRCRPGGRGSPGELTAAARMARESGSEAPKLDPPRHRRARRRRSVAALALWQWATWPDVARLAARESRERRHSSTAGAAREQAAGRAGRPAWAPVAYARISDELKVAVVVAEDIDFFSHRGFAVAEIKKSISEALEEKELPRGASTITQQLAKNLWLSPSRNPWRKVKEALLTRALERHLDKRRILELYLNVVELGPGVYGAEAAARRYFGKSAAALGRREAAELAASLSMPSKWHPGVARRGYQRRVGADPPPRREVGLGAQGALNRVAVPLRSLDLRSGPVLFPPLRRRKVSAPGREPSLRSALSKSPLRRDRPERGHALLVRVPFPHVAALPRSPLRDECLPSAPPQESLRSGKTLAPALGAGEWSFSESEAARPAAVAACPPWRRPPRRARRAAPGPRRRRRARPAAREQRLVADQRVEHRRLVGAEGLLLVSSARSKSRVAAARSPRESASRPRLVSVTATCGWSGPSVASRTARARRQSSAASSTLPAAQRQ